MGKLSLIYMALLVLVYSQMRGSNALEMNYYGMDCPYAEMIVHDVVTDAIQKDPTLAAALLRLHFHDCIIKGCEASVLIDSPNGDAEKDSPSNVRLRGFDVVDEIKLTLESRCPSTVSCADILALAARGAVYLAGGPFYRVMTGRRDGFASRIEDTKALPAPTLNISGLVELFVNKNGFTLPQLVAISGGHTLGTTRCLNFKNRLQAVDPTMEASFAQVVSRTCTAGDSTTVPFDMTENKFDTVYFRALQRGRGVLTSDQTLYTSPQTKSIVDSFASNNNLFFYHFTQGMLRMGQLDLLEGDEGEIRSDCRSYN